MLRFAESWFGIVLFWSYDDIEHFGDASLLDVNWKSLRIALKLAALTPRSSAVGCVLR